MPSMRNHRDDFDRDLNNADLLEKRMRRIRWILSEIFEWLIVLIYES